MTSGVTRGIRDYDAQAQLSRDAVLEDLLRETRELLQVDTAAILLLDVSRQFLVATAALGIEEEVREGSRVRAGLGFAGRVAAEAQPVILDRITPRNVVNPLLLRRGITSMLGVPLLAAAEQDGRGEVLGVLHVGSLTERRFDQVEVALLERLARRVAAGDRIASCAGGQGCCRGVAGESRLPVAGRRGAGHGRPVRRPAVSTASAVTGTTPSRCQTA